MNSDLSAAAIQAAINADWDRACQINRNLLKENPDDLDSLNRLSRAYLELGDIKKATLTLKKVLKIDKYNQIALKNLARMGNLDKRKRAFVISTNDRSTSYCDFVEEPGKTRIVNLVNVAAPKTLSSLRPATPVLLKAKRHTVQVFLSTKDETYLGSLPDDLGHRLDLLIQGGNQYEAFIKSASKSAVTVFIREISKTKKLRYITSFPQTLAIDHLLSSLEEDLSEESAKKSGKEDNNDEEEDVFNKKITELHGDEEPPEN